MKYRLIPAILVSIVLSVVSSRIVYFGFTSNYNSSIFSKPMFEGAFSRGVYKYRILSKYLLLALDEDLKRGIPEKDTPMWIHKHAKNDSEHLYYAFFYLNTFFLVLMSVVWASLIDSEQLFKLCDSEKYLWLFLLPIVVNLTQFAVCPYDISGYFLQLLIGYIYLHFVDRYYIATICSVGVLIAVSTLNRESAALSVSWLLPLLFLKKGFSKTAFLGALVFTISFLAPYLLLRHFIPEPSKGVVINTMAGNFTNSLNITGLIFWGIFFFLSTAVSITKENRLLIFLYHVISLPYIIVCLKDGVLWEVRLYMPLFIGSMLLSRLDTTGLRFSFLSFASRVE